MFSSSGTEFRNMAEEDGVAVLEVNPVVGLFPQGGGGAPRTVKDGFISHYSKVYHDVLPTRQVFLVLEFQNSVPEFRNRGTGGYRGMKPHASACRRCGCKQECAGARGTLHLGPCGPERRPGRGPAGVCRRSLLVFSCVLENIVGGTGTHGVDGELACCLRAG